GRHGWYRVPRTKAAARNFGHWQAYRRSPSACRHCCPGVGSARSIRCLDRTRPRRLAAAVPPWVLPVPRVAPGWSAAVAVESIAAGPAWVVPVARALPLSWVVAEAEAEPAEWVAAAWWFVPSQPSQRRTAPARSRRQAKRGPNNACSWRLLCRGWKPWLSTVDRAGCRRFVKIPSRRYWRSGVIQPAAGGQAALLRTDSVSSNSPAVRKRSAASGSSRATRNLSWPSSL